MFINRAESSAWNYKLMQTNPTLAQKFVCWHSRFDTNNLRFVCINYLQFIFYKACRLYMILSFAICK